MTRPKYYREKINSLPSQDSEEGKIARASRLVDLEEFIKRDPLVQSINIDYSSVNVLKETLVRLAEISSVIAFERREAIVNGEASSLIARREITALTALRDATLKMIDQKLKQQEIDMDSTPFRNLVRFMAETFQESMNKAGIPFNEQRSVMSSLSKLIDQADWKSSVAKAMTGQKYGN